MCSNKRFIISAFLYTNYMYSLVMHVIPIWIWIPLDIQWISDGIGGSGLDP